MESVPRPVIVLTPGVSLSASVFEKAENIFRSKGYETISLTLPGVGHGDKSWYHDRDFIIESIAPHFERGREVVLVAHSYSSIPSIAATKGNSLEQRAARGEKGGIRCIIMIGSAFIPRSGISLLQTFGGNWPSWQGPVEGRDDGLAYPKEDAKYAFFNDLPDHEVDQSFASLQGQSILSLTDPVDYAAENLAIPAFYLVTENDAAIAVQHQNLLCDSFPQIRRLTIPTGHAPFLKDPELFVARIEEFLHMDT
ncbi:Alpha/Beta hydrolase protein [Biscogniauxia mediterranea]|nr:Alpha/Beta hydrolase protein [Biscogniauxia mediterranea]